MTFDEYLLQSGPIALQEFFEFAPDGMMIVAESGKIVVANREMGRLFGYAEHELLGQPIEVLVPERHRARHRAAREHYSASPKRRGMGNVTMPLAGRRRDGSEFPVEISLSPLSTDQGVFVAAAVRDISERKRVEDELRRSLQEKEVLLKEVHHRVKNNLQIVSSMLNLQMQHIRDENLLSIFQESQSRVRSIALFHEKLYQSKDLAHVDIAAYLRGVAHGLFAAYGINTDDIVLEIDAEDVLLGVHIAISCGLIVNELVSNALKYAFPNGRQGRVQISLQRSGSDVVLEVADDGVGMALDHAGRPSVFEDPNPNPNPNPDPDLENPNTLGLKLVAIFTEQIRGQMKVDRTAGIRYEIRFPAGDNT